MQEGVWAGRGGGAAKGTYNHISPTTSLHALFITWLFLVVDALLLLPLTPLALEAGHHARNHLPSIATRNCRQATRAGHRHTRMM